MLALHLEHPGLNHTVPLEIVAASISAMFPQFSDGVPGSWCMLGHLSSLSSQDENAALAHIR